MERYSINLKRHWDSGGNILFTMMMCIISAIFLVHYKSVEIVDSIWMAAIVFVIWGGPSILLHLNYYYINRSSKLFYYREKGKIEFINDKDMLGFTMDDIDSVVRFVSSNFAAGRAAFLPWDNYNHSSIFLKNGQRIIITSLLVQNLNLPIPEEKITTRKNFFRLILS